MKLFKLAGLTAFGFAAILAGCSTSDSNSTNASESKNAAAASNVQTFDVHSCTAEIDALSLNKLELAKEDMNDFYSQLADGNFTKAQTISANIKKTYDEILSKYPSYCEAQLGYAVAVVTDIFTNQAFIDLVDSLNSKEKSVNLYKMSAEDAAYVAVKASSMSKADAEKFITDRIQETIANNLLPAVDTAINYMTNVVNDGSITVLYKNDGRSYELDNGEFAPALGALYLVRAIMVAAASRNIDYSLNGSDAWINELDSLDLASYKNNAAAKHLVNLLKKDNPYGTVKKEWVKAYSNIPNMLDSAISYVQVGLQYGIEEAKNGLAGQLHDPYVVGNGEDADVSVQDFENAIDALSQAKDALHNDYTFDIDETHSVTINVSKFFQLTNLKEYLPYYQMVEPENWFLPSATDFWTDTVSENAYAAYALEDAVFSAMGEGIDHKRVDLDNEFYNEEVEDYVNANTVRFEAEYGYGYAYGYLDIVTDGCKVTLKPSSRFTNYEYNEYGGYDYVYNSETGEYERVSNFSYPVPDTIKINTTVTIPSDFCKVEGGVTKFLTSERSVKPNLFNLTDKSGKVTISFRDLLIGVKYPCEEHFHYRSYNVEELKKLVIFPDVTFGGVLPGMTEEKFWDLFTADWDEIGEEIDDALGEVEDILNGEESHSYTDSSYPIDWDPYDTYY